jgi:hypothetical protein
MEALILSGLVGGGVGFLGGRAGANQTRPEARIIEAAITQAGNDRIQRISGYGNYGGFRVDMQPQAQQPAQPQAQPAPQVYVIQQPAPAPQAPAAPPPAPPAAPPAPQVVVMPIQMPAAPQQVQQPMPWPWPVQAPAAPQAAPVAPAVPQQVMIMGPQGPQLIPWPIPQAQPAAPPVPQAPPPGLGVAVTAFNAQAQAGVNPAVFGLVVHLTGAPLGTIAQVTVNGLPAGATIGTQPVHPVGGNIIQLPVNMPVLLQVNIPAGVAAANYPLTIVAQAGGNTVNINQDAAGNPLVLAVA